MNDPGPDTSRISPESDDDWQDRLRATAEVVRASGILGRSAQINRLFDFLIERSLAGRIPKEIEVAQEVFGLSISEQIGHDATVRMSIHRLRKKLEDMPVNALGERLVLPRGEYRLQLLAPAEEAVPASDAPAGDRDGSPHAPDRPVTGKDGRRSRSRWLAAGIVLMLLVSALAGWRWLPPLGAAGADPRLRSAFWQPLSRAHFPALIVSGDRYTFGEVNGDGEIFRQLRDPAITSSEALDRYRTHDAKQGARYVDLNLFDLPSAMAPALSLIAPVVSEATQGQSASSSITSSAFTTDMLKAHNIVYVGLLSDMRDLHEPIFYNSGFELTPTGDLVDRRSHRRFQSDWADPSQERMLRLDYAYIASLPGPHGSRILVIAGMNDPALAESAQIVTRRAELDALTAKVGKAQAFEALYEVRTFGPSSVASQLIVARPMQVGHQWRALPGG